MPVHSRPLSGPPAAAGNACAHHRCRSSCRGNDVDACPLSGSPRQPGMPAHALCWPSRGGHLGSAFCLSLCPRLQCLGLCGRGSLSHVCEFEARPVAPSAGKSAAFAVRGAAPTAAAIINGPSIPGCATTASHSASCPSRAPSYCHHPQACVHLCLQVPFPQGPSPFQECHPTHFECAMAPLSQKVPLAALPLHPPSERSRTARQQHL
jgi:hypothetical protein